MLREWMRDHDLDKILWRIICVLILMFAFNLKIVHLSWEQPRKVLEYKREHYTKNLNEYELDEFIKLYPKFKEYTVKENVDIDKIAESPASADWLTKRWFIYQAWDAQRFFYIKNRAQEAMNIIKMRKESAGYVKQLSKQIQEKNAKEMAKNRSKYKNKNTEDENDLSQKMLNIHKSRVDDIGDFTFDELELVEKKSVELKNLFN